MSVSQANSLRAWLNFKVEHDDIHVDEDELKGVRGNEEDDEGGN